MTKSFHDARLGVDGVRDDDSAVDHNVAVDLTHAWWTIASASIDDEEVAAVATVTFELPAGLLTRTVIMCQ